MQGSGTIGDPYLVATASDLNDVRNNLSAYYKQIADIDLSGYENWEPIETVVGGGFDGGGYNITNLRINISSTYVGLFSRVEASSTPLRNINVVNAEVINLSTSSSSYTGILCAYVDCSIANCMVSGKVQGSGEVGGICGRFQINSSGISMEKCYADCEVKGSLAGGICGYAYNSSSSRVYYFYDCYSKGTVEGVEEVGGICGNLRLRGRVQRCYSTANVKGVGGVGGLVGTTGSSCNIRESFALNSKIIRSFGDGQNFGRIVGFKHSTTNITDCYALNTMEFYPNGGEV